jgi:CheY-like chemotaxis protein
MMIASVLDALGVKTVFYADDGQKGFESFLQNRPDIVLTDWLMEPVDGIELTRTIRNDPHSPNQMVPIIMITGYCVPSRVIKARDSGVTEFLVKPFTANDLAKRLSHVINHPRDFIEHPEYFGPDRRRRNKPDYKGPFRRESDFKNNSALER